MEKLITFLDGKKTYIAAFITAVVNLLIAFNVIVLTPEQIVAVEGILGALLSTTIRLGISNK